MTICLGVTFARGGSKGLPGKNIKPLAGVPLLGRAIEAAQACKSIERHIVSTDDEAIAAVARAYGAEVPFMRPSDLASDTAPELLSWVHALRTLGEEGYVPDVIVSVPATSPLRLPKDIDRVVEKLLSTDADMAIAVTRSERSPYFNMVNVDQDDRVKVVVEGAYARRQDAPAVFDITTVAYAARPTYVLKTPHLYQGDVRCVEVDAETAVDIDTELDFAFAEFLIERRSKL